ncbi:MAG: hypothetical protein JWN67_4600 [Actinomycetia bacterium]|nr:hypothetical protein [Actinomycetes bacterium]
MLVAGTSTHSDAVDLAPFVLAGLSILGGFASIWLTSRHGSKAWLRDQRMMATSMFLTGAYSLDDQIGVHMRSSTEAGGEASYESCIDSLADLRRLHAHLEVLGPTDLANSAHELAEAYKAAISSVNTRAKVLAIRSHIGGDASQHWPEVMTASAAMDTFVALARRTVTKPK